MKNDPDLQSWQGQFAQAYGQQMRSPLSLADQILHRTHTLIERMHGPDAEFDAVLEVGAGPGVHHEFIRHRYRRYVMSDSSADFIEQLRQRHQGDRRVELLQADAGRLPFATDSINRLIATHVLEHLERPHAVLREWVRVLKDGGMLSLILPCDPGLAWRVGRHLGPRARWHRQGLPYDYLMAREHINSCFNLLSLLRYYFDHRAEYWWPMRIPSPDLNLIYGVNIRIHKKRPHAGGASP